MKSPSFAFLLCAFICGAAAWRQCPPRYFDSVPNFDVAHYISASWYIQEQRPLVYQPLDSLFCVVATYEFQNPDDPSEGLLVFNFANRGGVNGEVSGSSGIGNSTVTLQALIPDINDSSKLRVGPKELEDVFGPAAINFYGDYWVVAVGPISDPAVGYDWAIVSGGPPRVKTEGGCRTGNVTGSESQTNDIGLWLFSRKPVDPYRTKLMRHVAKALGFDISVLRKVEQSGCTFEGARIK